MRRMVGGGGLLALLLGSGALAMDARVAGALVSAGRGETERLVQALAQREAELESLRRQVELEHLSYEEAARLGVVDAVRRTRLPERSQRNIAVAIIREARKSGVDPLLVLAVIRIESAFNNFAVSRVGAMGLMQVMPGTGAYLADKYGRELRRPTDLFDYEINIELGTAYLADLIQRFGSVEHALVAYNAGPGLARRILARREVRGRFMQGYPSKVLQAFQAFKRKAAHLALAEGRAPDPS